MSRLFCITESSIDVTNGLLKTACEARGVEYVEIDWRFFNPRVAAKPEPGDMIYRPAVAWGAAQVEQFLFEPGIAMFHDPSFNAGDQRIAFVKAGVPFPKTAFGVSADRHALRDLVEELGGFPVIAKAPGREGGAGTIYVPCWETLFSVIDFAGQGLVLQRYFEHVVAYRLVYVGDRVIAADASYPAIGDFRTNSFGGVIGAVTPPAAAVDIVNRAARAIGAEFGGADVLENASGEMVVTELNYPCYFPGTQEKTAVDIAGAMLDWLLDKAKGKRSRKQKRRPGGRRSAAKSSRRAKRS